MLHVYRSQLDVGVWHKIDQIDMDNVLTVRHPTFQQLH